MFAESKKYLFKIQILLAMVWLPLCFSETPATMICFWTLRQNRKIKMPELPARAVGSGIHKI